jgi:hypothetical protein
MDPGLLSDEKQLDDEFEEMKSADTAPTEPPDADAG